MGDKPKNILTAITLPANYFQHYGKNNTILKEGLNSHEPIQKAYSETL